MLDECANQHAGMAAEERPIIGVRGQRKDLARVARLIQVPASPQTPGPVASWSGVRRDRPGARCTRAGGSACGAVFRRCDALRGRWCGPAGRRPVPVRGHRPPLNGHVLSPCRPRLCESLSTACARYWLARRATALRIDWRGARACAAAAGGGGGALSQKKRQERKEGATRPVTIVLLDDRKQDAYGNCQVPRQRPPRGTDGRGRG